MGGRGPARRANRLGRPAAGAPQRLHRRDAGRVGPDAGPGPDQPETIVPNETTKLKPGCGCQGATGGLLAFVALLGLALRPRRTV